MRAAPMVRVPLGFTMTAGLVALAACGDSPPRRGVSSGDTTGTSASWVTAAEPKRAFNLLDLQNGQTAILGTTTLAVGQYKALRMTLDARKSSVAAINGRRASTGDSAWSPPVLYAYVEQPMEVGDGTADAPRGTQLVGPDVPNVSVAARAETTVAELPLAKGDRTATVMVRARQ